MPRPACVALCSAAALAVLASSALPASVQGQDDAARSLRRTLVGLDESSRLQLFAPGVVVTDGTFLEFDNDSVTVASADAVFSVGLDEIEGLSVERSRWASVALQSAAVGVVGGAMAGFILGTAQCGRQWEGCDTHAGRVALRWSVVFGSLGGILGGLVGSRLRGWHQVFP